MKILLGNEAEKAEAGSIDGDDDDDEEEEEEQDGLKAFEEVEGDCKLVLIVRTDLGMNKGSSPCSPSFPHPSQAKKPPPSHRQNRRSSLPRHTVQLQSPHLTQTPPPAITAVGIHRASENRCADQIRRAA